MTELIAQGKKPSERWRRTLPTGAAVILGAAPDAWQVPWEPWLSRRHVELIWSGERLHLRRLETATNPVYFRGAEVTAADLGPDDYFVIGSTQFRLGSTEAGPTPSDLGEVRSRTVSAQELGRLPFRDAPRRLDVLTRLPDVISSATNDLELFTQLVSLLLAGIPRADAVALVALSPGEGDSPSVDVLHWDRRSPAEGAFEPSKRLVHEAVGRLKDTVVHVWPSRSAPGPTGSATQGYTLKGDFDWAFCAPVRGEACRGWGIYVAGRFTDPEGGTLLAALDQNALSDDLKFVALVASVLGSVRRVQSLERQQTVLGQFFSPGVLHVLLEADPEAALTPHETEVTVLFCDLRGFARKAEAEAEDLLGLLERVSKALGVMTREILDHRGVVADFLGDAALGFWGWPLPEPDATERACAAALGIRLFYEAQARRPGHPLAGFRAGIGLATGRAVAGRLGTRDQGKVSVFGPVVNLASRLEGMTKLLHVPILIDEPTARVVREKMPPAQARCRRLARVRPYGLENPVLVSELLPPLELDGGLTDEHLAHYEAGLDAFLRGDWDEALARLHQVPPHDLGKDLLTGFIIANNHAPPAGWDGVVPLASKG